MVEELKKILTFNAIEKKFGRGKNRKKVINDFSLQIFQSEIVGFIGANGAGKSTIIKLLLQFHTPDQGSIEVFGYTNNKNEFRNKIGYLNEVPSFYNHLTADETLKFTGKIHGLDKKKIKKRSDELLDLLNLSHARKQAVGTFSKGMKQRLGFAVAMIHDPPLYIFDEPMSGLDPLGREMIKNIFIQLKEKEKTVFFSSHILSDIEELCSRLVFIHKGNLLFNGEVNDFKKAGETIEQTFVRKITDWEYDEAI